MATNFWSDKAQFLLNALRFKDGVSIGEISNDPRVTAIDANTGSVALYDGVIYTKQDDGLTTNWLASATVEELAHLCSTGVMEGGEFVIVNGTTIDIMSFKYSWVDITDSANPTIVTDTKPDELGVVITNLGASATYLAYNPALDTFVQSTTRFTQAQKRDLVSLGLVLHPLGAITVASPNTKVFLNNPVLSIDDMSNAIGSTKLSGNVIGHAGANLNIAKTAGTIFKFSANMDNDAKDPSTTTQLAIDTSDGVNPLRFFQELYADGVGGISFLGPSTTIDPAVWDDGSGVLQTISVNSWSFKKVYIAPVSGGLYLEVGTEEYNTLNIARQRFLTAPGRISIEIDRDGLLLGYILHRGGATDLSNEGDAIFIQANKFGEGVGGGAAGIDNNRQEVYDNSSSGQTILSSDVGAKIDRDSSTPIVGDIRQITDNVGSVIHWAVSSTRNLVNKIMFNNGTLGAIESTGTEDNILITDSEGSGVYRRPVRFVEMQDWKETIPTAVVVLRSGSGSVSNASNMAGKRNASLGTSNNAIYELPSLDMSSHYVYEKEVAVQFDAFFNPIHNDKFFYDIEVSDDNVAWTVKESDIAITENGTYNTKVQLGTTEQYTRAVIKSVYVGLDISIGIDNYCLDLFPADVSDIKEVIKITADYTAEIGQMVIVDGDNGVVSVTLPEAKEGDRVTVKNNVTDPVASQTLVIPTSGSIEGAPSIEMDSDMQSMTFINDGADWQVI